MKFIRCILLTFYLVNILDFIVINLTINFFTTQCQAQSISTKKVWYLPRLLAQNGYETPFPASQNQDLDNGSQFNNNSGLTPNKGNQALSANNSTDPAKPFVPKIVATGFVTWWSYDSSGYHPTIMIRLCNVSPVNLSYVPIKFQARFADSRTGQVTVAHQSYCNEFNQKQIAYLKFRGPSAFDLASDVNAWPRLECKVMCRVGEVNDAGTQTLLNTRVDSTILTDDQATNNLSQMPDIRSFNQQFSYNGSTLNSGFNDDNGDDSPGLSAQPETMATYQKIQNYQPVVNSFLKSVDVPGIDQAFYLYQEKFGKPLHSEFLGNWTWVQYGYKPLSLNIYAGSKAHKGKVNLLILQIPGYLVPHTPEALQFVKLFTGVYSTQELSAPIHHVKYTHAGRVESVTCFASSYSIVIIKPRNQNDYCLIAIGAISADWEASLKNDTQGSNLLSFLIPFLEPNMGL